MEAQNEEQTAYIFLTNPNGVQRFLEKINKAFCSCDSFSNYCEPSNYHLISDLE